MKYSFDLHIHSCLSPCGSNENTPTFIAGLSAVYGTDIVALTDHNSCKNCEVFLKASEYYGILGICGMELTTAEEVHVVCLFPELKAAMAFDEYVHSKLPLIENKPKLFGQQLITDIDDNVTGEESLLLISATGIGIYEVSDLVKSYGGIAYPAHIDRDSDALISNLGFWDSEMKFPMAELSYNADSNIWSQRKDLKGVGFIKGSDAHHAQHLKEAYQYADLPALNAVELIKWLNNNV